MAGSIVARKDEWDMGGADVTKAMGNCGCMVSKSGYDITTIVNRMLANGAPDTEVQSILGSLPKGTLWQDRVPSLPTIRKHRENHLPFRVAAMRKVLEKRAAEQGMIIEEGAENILTNLGMAEVIARKGFSDIIDGKAVPTVKETLEAIKISEQFEKEASDSFDAVRAMAQIQRIMSAVQKHVSESVFAKILVELDNSEPEVVDEAYWEED